MKAIYSFKGSHNDELNFKKGAVITLTQKGVISSLTFNQQRSLPFSTPSVKQTKQKIVVKVHYIAVSL